MKRFIVLLSVLATLISACGDGDPAASPLTPSLGLERSQLDPDAPVAELAAGINDAGFALWRTQSPADNLVFSPMSIGHALLMARAAADEATGAAIDKALSLPDGVSAHDAWNTLELDMLANADRAEAVTVQLADRIWPRLDVTPDQAWIDLLATAHGVTVAPLDFAGDSAGSREIINEWVAERTNDLIPELVPEGFIDGSTALVLTDAVYFEARWQRVFGKYGPVSGEFTRLDGSEVAVEFLQDLEMGRFPHGQGDGYDFVSLPYDGERFSMLLIIPDEGSFAPIRDMLSQDLLDEIDAAGSTGPLELLMPKWTTTTALDLMDWLREIGAAPGSYPAITPEAFLDAAVHGADIAVDDQGTVAAAATALGFAESGPPEPEMVIRADRPFLYVVRDLASGVILFAGQVTDPTS